MGVGVLVATPHDTKGDVDLKPGGGLSVNI